MEQHENVLDEACNDSFREASAVQVDRAEAEALCRHALKTGDDGLDPEHPYVLACLISLADPLYEKGDFAAAEPLFRRLLASNQDSNKFLLLIWQRLI